MKLLTTRKTLLVGAMSLIGSASAVVMSNTQHIDEFAFFQNNPSAQVVDSAQQVSTEKSYILQGLGADALVTAVQKVGGVVSREFPIINAISALLTNAQLSALGTYTNLRVTEDRSVMTTGLLTDFLGAALATKTDTYIAKQTNASVLHDMGIKGHGVTVAVVDSGINLERGDHLFTNSESSVRRILAIYDATHGTQTRNMETDPYGHGTHVTNIVASSAKDESGVYNGIAPDVRLVSVKAFNAHGEGSYSQVLDGLNWIYTNHARANIRVVNLSLGAAVQSSYWDDPINQAVMRLWDAGIVVVTSAGNTGNDLGTITVPGNNPYIITVGAVTDNYTPYDISDDRVTTFSGRGPTVEGFVKPEIVTYGARIKAKYEGNLSSSIFGGVEGVEGYSSASGTSQAAAVITGTVALMLQMDPSATPDDIKCRLMATANAGFNSNTSDSPFVQGAGLADAYLAATSTATGCANLGLDIQADLDGIAHFMGPTGVDENGALFIQLNPDVVQSESTGWGVLNESTGWGVINESTGWGVLNESTGWGVLNESTGWGVANESTGWGVRNESTGWGVSNESTGWGVSNESTGWGVRNESTVRTESLGDASETVVVPGEDHLWDDTVSASELPLDFGFELEDGAE